MVDENIAVAAMVLKPRVGDGKDSDTWWTGGSNLANERSKRPKTVMAMRPSHFRSADRIYDYCTQGLPAEK